MIAPRRMISPWSRFDKMACATKRYGLASDLPAIASAVPLSTGQRRRGPALAKTASRCQVTRRPPIPDLVQLGSAHPGEWRASKKVRRPHAQAGPGVSDAGPRCAMPRERWIDERRALRSCAIAGIDRRPIAATPEHWGG